VSVAEEAKLVRTDAPSGTDLLRLSRRDRPGAVARLRELSDVQQAEACRELRPEVRPEFLMLLEHPENVVPLLPEAELVHTIRSGGMGEAAWLLEIATAEQRVACFDLDCWTDHTVDLERCAEWIDALIEAGRDTLALALDELDLELILLTLRRDTDVVIVGREDDPPDGYFTADGTVYWRVSDDAPHRAHQIAHTAFSSAQPTYWRIVYGMIFEPPTEMEEYALRWRTRRLNDLGFPDREDAMRVYRPLPPEKVENFGRLEVGTDALQPAPGVPRQFAGTLLGEALAEMDPASASEVLGQVLSVANWIAVADDMRLSEPESIPAALRKAVAGIDRGLRELAHMRNQPAAEVAARTRAIDLFRTGATLDPSLRRRAISGMAEPLDSRDG
jgi:hypothetical protein